MTDTVLILNSNDASSKDLSIGRISYIYPQAFRFENSSAKIAVNSFQFTNWFINISAALANNLIYYSDDVADAVKYSLTLSDGSYSVENLNTTIQTLLTANGHDGLFSVLPDYASNKAYIKFSDTLVNWYISFSAGTCWEILGFTLNQFVPADKTNVVNETVYATNVAAFNNIESINITTNLSNNVILGNNQSPVLLQVKPIVTVGNTQTSEPKNLLWADSSALSSGISEIRIQLTDQDGDPIFMVEEFTVILQIRTTPLK